MTKTESSNRILPLPDKIIRVLKEVKIQQIHNYINNKNKYSKDFLGYVCVDKNGKLFTPDTLSNRFRDFTKNGYNIIFHDLRHSCASILADSGLQLKDISKWLGHSDITEHQTYTSIYSIRKKY